MEALAEEAKRPLTALFQSAEVLEAMPSEVVLIKACFRRYVGGRWAEEAR